MAAAAPAVINHSGGPLDRVLAASCRKTNHTPGDTGSARGGGGGGSRLGSSRAPSRGETITVYPAGKKKMQFISRYLPPMQEKKKKT